MEGKQAPISINRDHRVPKLFDNLVTFRELVDETLGGHYAEVTVYKWVRQGMPKQKIRGKLYFSPKEVAQWLQRTS